MAYRVIIIEDDSMVAAIDRQYVESDRRFQVDGVFKSGGPALDYLAGHPADLIILDYYTPQMNGQEFLDRLRDLPQAPAVIAVTSANDPEIVENLLRRGVPDYLIKPFVFPRFRQALDRFLQRQVLLGQHAAGVDQQTIDRLIQLPDAPGAASGELSKGLNLSTLSMIREFFAAHPEEYFTSEQTAAQVHLSRITVRRYVAHMVETRELVSTIDYRTGGRPSIQYKFAGN